MDQQTLGMCSSYRPRWSPNTPPNMNKCFNAWRRYRIGRKAQSPVIIQACWATLARWWFQIFFSFTPNWGRFPIWLLFFGWVETTNQLASWVVFFSTEMLNLDTADCGMCHWWWSMPRFFWGNLTNCFDASSLRVLISHHLLNPVAGRIDECLDQARLLDQDDCSILSVRGLRRVDELFWFSKYDQIIPAFGRLHNKSSMMMMMMMIMLTWYCTEKGKDSENGGDNGDIEAHWDRFFQVSLTYCSFNVVTIKNCRPVIYI